MSEVSGVNEMSEVSDVSEASEVSGVCVFLWLRGPPVRGCPSRARFLFICMYVCMYT